MTRVLYRLHLAELAGGRQMITDQIADLGLVTRTERLVMAVFSCAAFHWVVMGLLVAAATTCVLTLIEIVLMIDACVLIGGVALGQEY
ncbi:hypothetical protein [Loktanella sp. M215]|uniref:hypothetical protein n=1 Tax=Loktanella sp. M215 TaxID=2675431 RepID=UPI001F2B3C11|nr:hypothetical protein [Loktanella sp. M215]MCF7699990.1 hypothetical protein [Loktanella sp. M215]